MVTKQYEPIYDINGIWEVYFNTSELERLQELERLYEQCDEVWKKIKLTFSNEKSTRIWR